MCDCQAEIAALRERLARLEALVSLSLSTKESNLEREGSVAAREELDAEWESAATTDRRRADLPDVDLHAEWYKYRRNREAQGKAISRADWLGWAYRTRLDHTNQPKPPAPERSAAASEAPKAGRPPAPAGIHKTDWLHIWDWAHPKPGRRPFWAESWGKPPGHPNCTLPAAAIAHALALRDARGSAAPAAYRGAA